MSIEKNTSLGNINISEEAIATLTGGIVTECYGVVGMASKKLLRDGLSELLKKDNYSKGIVVRKKDGRLELDVFIIVGHGIKISEISFEVQKNVKYMLEKTLQIELNSVNVYVQGVRVVN
ncbi:MAG: Asp23/Gls24 family envelope stress response protein [Anaerorhabdus sp.]